VVAVRVLVPDFALLLELLGRGNVHGCVGASDHQQHLTVEHADHWDLLGLLLLVAFLLIFLLFYLFALHVARGNLRGRVLAFVACIQRGFCLIQLVLNMPQLGLASIDALPLILQIGEVV